MTPEQKLKQYEQNMKLFVVKVEQEVSLLIQRYEQQIRKLKEQNKKLKNSRYSRYNPQNAYQLKDEDFQNFSPIKKFGGTHSPIIDSTFCMTSKQFPKIRPMFSNSEVQFGFQNELQRSRFQSSRLKRKQLQQDLLQSLQSGKNNLDLNTTKMLQLFGKQQKQKSQEFDEEEELPKSQNKSSGLNTSLASICDSLDKSFHAKKSRSKADKRKKKEQKMKEEKQQVQRNNEKMLKNQQIKNLLRTLRSNVNNLSSHPPEIVRGSKLLHSGKQTGKSAKLSKSKVMFNPVAVDITQRERRTQNNTSFNANQPQSILKNSSRILTKSLIGNMTSISQQI